MVEVYAGGSGHTTVMCPLLFMLIEPQTAEYEGPRDEPEESGYECAEADRYVGVFYTRVADEREGKAYGQGAAGE